MCVSIYLYFFYHSLTRLPLFVDFEKEVKPRIKTKPVPVFIVGGPLAKLMTSICRYVLTIKFVIVFRSFICDFFVFFYLAALVGEIGESN